MKYSSKVQRCFQSPMRKFHPYAVAAAAAGKTIYHLNIGQPDIETPPAFFEAIRKFHQPVLAYAPSPGLPELIDAIVCYYKKIGVSITADDVLITTGGSEALQFVCNCILDDGDEIILPEPFYSNYNTFISSTGATICPLHTSPADGYFYADRAKIEAAINPRTRAILVSNPGNPTGTVLTRDEMQMILEICVQHDIFLIADEVYREFIYSDEPLASFAQLPGGEEHVVLVDSVSKRFSACGARVGCIISRNRELMAQALKYCQARLSVATLDQIAAAALYSVGPEYFEAVRVEYKRRRDTVVRKLAGIPGVVYQCPKGAFYLMAALPIDDAEKFQRWLLEEFDDNGDTVMFAAGGGFYQSRERGRNEIRIAYVKEQHALERAMDLLALGIKQYNETH